MAIFVLVVSLFAIGFLCWLLFTLAVYALPFFVGLHLAFVAYHHGAGLVGAILVAFLTGIATFAIGQIAFALVRSPIFQGLIALVFAAPAAVAGYYATFGLLHIGVASEDWCTAFAVLGAALIGAKAFARLALFTEPGPSTNPAAPSS